MATAKLTDKTVQAAKAKAGERLELWDETTPGLCLRVSNPGDRDDGPQTRVWVWRYRTLDGRQPRLTLGDYSHKHSLKWAREQVDDLRVRVRRGEDPAGARKRARLDAKLQPLKTFDDLADAYLQACERGRWKPRRKQKRERTIEGERDILTRNVRPAIGKLRLEDVDRGAVRKILNDMMDRGVTVQTNRTHAVIRQVLAYGVGQERLKTNVAAAIAKPAEETPHTRVLSDAELRSFWSALERPPEDLRWPAKTAGQPGARLYVGRPLRIALQLATLLLVRRSEIAGMRRSELDLDQAVWLIPRERMKSGQPHLVPLPPRSVALIREALLLAKAGKEAAPQFVFPSPQKADKPVRACSVTHAMAGLCAALGIAPAAPHDLRRTGATALTSERIGQSPFIRSQVLGHSTDAGGGAAVSRVHYDVNTYVAEKRRALAAWEKLVLQIAGGRPATSGLEFSTPGPLSWPTVEPLRFRPAPAVATASLRTTNAKELRSRARDRSRSPARAFG